jgi:hypothetical protein
MHVKMRETGPKYNNHVACGILRYLSDPAEHLQQNIQTSLVKKKSKIAAFGDNNGENMPRSRQNAGRAS